MVIGSSMYSLYHLYVGFDIIMETRSSTLKARSSKLEARSSKSSDQKFEQKIYTYFISYMVDRFTGDHIVLF